MIPGVKKTVVYFTAYPVGGPRRGGSLCCTSTIQGLANDSRLDLHVITAGPKAWQASNEAFLDLLNVSHSFVEIEQDDSSSIRRFIKDRREKFAFVWEHALRSRSSDRERLIRAITERSPDVLVVEYLYSFLLARPWYFDNLPISYVKWNKESEFFRDMVGAARKMTIWDWIAWKRLDWFETRVDRHVERTICIGSGDVSSSSSKSSIIIPVVKNRSGKMWSRPDEQNLLFVGCTQHYPNLKAISWIVDGFANSLLKHCPKARITIIGAERSEFEHISIPPNVTLTKDLPDDQVEDLFTTSILFLCPVDNQYGQKFKLLECISMATPFIAGSDSLATLPGLEGFPTLDLNDPEKSAIEVKRLIARDSGLEELSGRLAAYYEQLLEKQKQCWYDVLFLDSGSTTSLKGEPWKVCI